MMTSQYVKVIEIFLTLCKFCFVENVILKIMLGQWNILVMYLCIILTQFLQPSCFSNQQSLRKSPVHRPCSTKHASDWENLLYVIMFKIRKIKPNLSSVRQKTKSFRSNWVCQSISHSINISYQSIYLSINQLFCCEFLTQFLEPSCFNSQLIDQSVSQSTSQSINLSRSVNQLTHWGRVTHICVGYLTIIGSDNGLSPGWRQAITWTNVGILLIGPLGTNFSEMLIGIHTFSFKKIHLKMSSGKWRPFCLGLIVLTRCELRIRVSQIHLTNATTH